MNENHGLEIELQDIDYDLSEKIRRSKNISEFKLFIAQFAAACQKFQAVPELTKEAIKAKSSSFLWESALRIYDKADYFESLEILQLGKLLTNSQVSVSEPLKAIIQGIIYSIEKEFMLLSTEAVKTDNIQEAHSLIEAINDLLQNEIPYLSDQVNNLSERLSKLEGYTKLPSKVIVNFDEFHINKEKLTFNRIIYAKTEGGITMKIHDGYYDRKRVAIKEYELGPKTSIKKKEAINVEIKCMEKISQQKNKNFVKFYGSSLEGHFIYLVMKYYDRTLKDYIAEKGRILSKEFFEIAKDLIQAFYALQCMDIYHGDIKPENIMIDKNGKVKIIDFSVSVIKVEPSTNSYTDLQEIHGTFKYMAPELAEAMRKGEALTKYRKEKADVFSLGITFLKMIKGNEWAVMNSYDIELKFAIDTINKEEKQLISGMVEIDPRNRKSFKELQSLFYTETI